MDTVTEYLSRNLVTVDWRGGGGERREGGGGGGSSTCLDAHSH